MGIGTPSSQSRIPRPMLVSSSSFRRCLATTSRNHSYQETLHHWAVTNDGASQQRLSRRFAARTTVGTERSHHIGRQWRSCRHPRLGCWCRSASSSVSHPCIFSELACVAILPIFALPAARALGVPVRYVSAYAWPPLAAGFSWRVRSLPARTLRVRLVYVRPDPAWRTREASCALVSAQPRRGRDAGGPVPGCLTVARDADPEERIWRDCRTLLSLFSHPRDLAQSERDTGHG